MDSIPDTPPSREHSGGIYGHLRSSILSQVIPPGHRLPAERALAAQYGVSRRVARSTLAQLQSEGLVREISPRIRVVSDPISKSPSPADIVIVVTDMSGITEPGSRNIVHRLFFGVTAALVSHRLTPLVQAPCGAEELRFKLQSMSAVGLILLQDLSPHDLGRVLPLLQQPVCPTVVVGDSLPDQLLVTLNCDQVRIDHRHGAYTLTKRLIDQGCRRIQQACGPDPHGRSWRKERRAGHHDACREAGLPLLPVIDLPSPPWPSGDRESWERRARMTAGFLIEHVQGAAPVDALMLESDGAFFDVVLACKLLGCDPERDILIVGYDNYWESLPESRWDPCVPFATIDPHLNRVGLAMVESLLARRTGFDSQVAKCITIPGELLCPIRASAL